MKTGETEERLHTESVVLVEIYEWAVISKPLDLNKTKHSRQQQRGNTPPTFSHSAHFLQPIQLLCVVIKGRRFMWRRRGKDVSFLLKCYSSSPLSSLWWAGLRCKERTQVKETWMQFRRLETQPEFGWLWSLVSFGLMSVMSLMLCGWSQWCSA